MNYNLRPANLDLRPLLTHPLVSGTFFVFSGGILGSFFSFLFNLLMSRNLSVSNYGTLISLISVVTLLSVPAGALAPTIISVTSKYFVDKNFGALKSFYLKMLKPLFIAGVLVFIIFLVFQKPLNSFFQISGSNIILFVGIATIFGYLALLNNTFLQSNLSFKTLSFSSSLSQFLKMIVGFLLVIFGFGIVGAMVGYTVSLLVPTLIGIIYFRKIIFASHLEKVHIPYKSLIQYGIPSAIVIFCLNSFISTDIILVKHLFDPRSAGLYAGLSLIGKVIFYLTAPVMTVMFPIITKKFNNKEGYRKTLYLSILMVGVAGFGITAFYYAFSNFTILFFLKNTSYLSISNYLGLFGLFITLYSIVSLFAYYFLSIKKTKVYIPLVIGAVLQIVLIVVIHSNFYNIVYSSISSQVVVLVLLFFYYFRSLEKKGLMG